MQARKCALLALVACLPAATWGAEQKTVRLEYQLDVKEAQCASEAEIRAQVAARLGYDPFQPGAAHLAKMTIVERNARLKGAVTLHKESGELIGSREVESAQGSCAAMAEVLALALAVAIDPDVLTVPLTAPPRKPVTPQVAAAVPPAPVLPPPPRARGNAPRAGVPPLSALRPQPPLPVVPPPPPSVEPAGSSSVWSVSLGGTLAVALLPQVALGVHVNGRWKLSAFSLALEGEYFPNTNFEALGGKVATSLLRGGLLACGHLSVTGLCGRVTGGVFQADGFGFDNPQWGVSPSVSAGPVFFVEGQPVSHFLIRGGIGLDFAVIKNGVFVGPNEVWRAPPVAFGATFALGWSSQ